MPIKIPSIRRSASIPRQLMNAILYTVLLLAAMGSCKVRGLYMPHCPSIRLISLAGLPPQISFSGTSLVTTEHVPITALFPMCTSFSTVVPVPILFHELLSSAVFSACLTQTGECSFEAFQGQHLPAVVVQKCPCSRPAQAKESRPRR